MDATRYTKAEIEDGRGTYTRGGTVVLQRGCEDVFGTAPQDSGWVLNHHSGWHIAGSFSGHGSEVEWIDVRST